LLMPGRVSFIAAPDRASSWLVRSSHTTGPTDALLPPGSVSPLDRSVRLPYWTRCSWSEPNAQLRFEAPDACKTVSVEAAVREARRWGGQDRWVLEETLDYIDLLLTYVSERISHEGRLSRETSRVLADPALDLLGELREVAADEQQLDYAEMIDCELAKLLSPALRSVPQVATVAAVKGETVCCHDAHSAMFAILRTVCEARGDERGPSQG
jgi:hypothetical protein